MNQIHYTIEVENDEDATWDGQTNSPPEVGDIIKIPHVNRIETVKVVQRIWRTGEETLGGDASRAWGHSPGDHCHVTLICSKKV